MPIILRLIEDVDPSVFEGQLEYAQHVTAIRRSVEQKWTPKSGQRLK